VILVHDVVADPKVGERRERAAEAGVRPRRALAENLGVRQEDEPKVAPDEAAPGGRDGEANARIPREGLARLVHRRLDLADEAALAQRLAAVREGDDDAVARALETRELVLGLCQPACGDRRPLRLELERLSTRKRVELGGAVERNRAQPGSLKFATERRRSLASCARLPIDSAVWLAPSDVCEVISWITFIVADVSVAATDCWRAAVEMF